MGGALSGVYHQIYMERHYQGCTIRFIWGGIIRGVPSDLYWGGHYQGCTIRFIWRVLSGVYHAIYLKRGALLGVYHDIWGTLLGCTVRFM